MGYDFKVSVLIPSFNSEMYIEECVKSVINQTLTNIEIICIDAKSEDNTLSILERLQKSYSCVKVISSDMRSYGHQMNLGLSHARGKYISIVESDDFIDKHMLEDLVKLAEEYDSEITKSTFYEYYDDAPEPKKTFNDEKIQLKNIEVAFNIEECPQFLSGHPSIWAAIYENSFIKNNNITFIEEKGAGWVDNPFFLETALLAKKIVYRHIPYYYYRKTNVNSSSNNLKDLTIPVRRMIECLEIVEKYNCTNNEVLKVIYDRAFVYLNSPLWRDKTGKYRHIVMPYIQKMLLMLNEDIVSQLGRCWQNDYYKYISPLRMLDNVHSEVKLSNNELNLIVKENDYLYSELERINSKNSKLKKKNKKYEKEIKSIKDSKSYKFGSLVAKPYRKLRNLLLLMFFLNYV